MFRLRLVSGSGLRWGPHKRGAYGVRVCGRFRYVGETLKRSCCSTTVLQAR